MINIDEIIKQATWTEEDAAQLAYYDSLPDPVTGNIYINYYLTILKEDKSIEVTIEFRKKSLSFIINDGAKFKKLITNIFKSNLNSDELGESLRIEYQIPFASPKELDFNNIDFEIRKDYINPGPDMYDEITDYIFSIPEVEAQILEEIIQDI